MHRGFSFGAFFGILEASFFHLATMKHRKKGFTIVELLVVISIIGLLASIAAVLLTNARKQARDNRRIEDLKQIQTALELYFKDNKQYPLSRKGENNWAGHCTGPDGSWGDGNSADDKYIPDLVDQDYIAKLPLDPRFDRDGRGLNVAQCYAYQAKQIPANSGQWQYKLVAYNVMESICDGSDGDSLPDPGDDCNPQFMQVLDEPGVLDHPTISLSSIAKDQF